MFACCRHIDGKHGNIVHTHPWSLSHPCNGADNDQINYIGSVPIMSLRLRLGASLAAVASLFSIGCAAAPAAQAVTYNPAPISAATARIELNALKTDITPYLGTYNRTKQFGTAWIDVDLNHCDTRNDILRRDLTNDVISANDNCTVFSGHLNDPYTAKSINFIRGKTTSSAVQIDHVIPLHYAIQRGADKWTYAKRVAFANDPMNLLAVDGPANSQKSDKGPAAWMPSNKAYHCTYAIKFTHNLYKNNLQILYTDKVKLKSVLATC